jgi:cytochrome b
MNASLSPPSGPSASGDPQRIPADSRASGVRTPERLRRVVDAPTRMFHALFGLSMVGAYLTAESEHWRAVHEALGYALVGLLTFRVVYGFVGPQSVRWAVRVRQITGAVGSTLKLLRELRGGIWPALNRLNFLQHALMTLLVSALLLGTLPALFSGVAMSQEWGPGWWLDVLSEVHESLGEGLMAVALAHVGWVAVSSVWRRRNLAEVMLTGHQSGVGPDLIRTDRRWLAIMLLGGVLAWLIWSLAK